MASSLNSKRVALMAIAVVGLIAAAICMAVLALGVREPSRERLFLVGSILIVSVACLFLSVRFKGDALELERQLRDADYKRDARAEADIDDVPLPQNRAQGNDPEEAAPPRSGGGRDSE